MRCMSSSLWINWCLMSQGSGRPHNYHYRVHQGCIPATITKCELCDHSDYQDTSVRLLEQTQNPTRPTAWSVHLHNLLFAWLQIDKLLLECIFSVFLLQPTCFSIFTKANLGPGSVSLIDYFLSYSSNIVCISSMQLRPQGIVHISSPSFWA